MKTVTALGDFSTTSFTMVGLGEPRVVRSGVVGGSFFDVMGLRPVRGRLIDATDDVPNAARVAVLTHRFWTTALGSDPDVSSARRCAWASARRRSSASSSHRCPIRPKPRSSRTSSRARTTCRRTMVTGRTHRMTELFGRLAPGADLEAARTELRAVHGAIVQRIPRGLSGEVRLPDRREAAAGSDHVTGANGAPRPAGRVGADLHHCVLQRREPDPGPIGPAGRRAGHPGGARRRFGRAAPHAARGKPAALRHRRHCSA